MLAICRKRDSLRGLEDVVFDRVCQSAGTEEQSGKWLRAPLEQAAAAGDAELASKLLAAGARGNAIMEATRGGHEMLVRNLLLEKVSLTEHDGITASLHVASTLGHAGIMKFLLDWGANKDGRDSKGRTSVHLAAAHGHHNALDALMAVDADPDLLSLEDKSSPLGLAIRGGHLEIASTLILFKAKVGRRHGAHYNPLHEAAIGNRATFIDALMEAGADLEARERKSGWGRTPLQCAAERGSTEAVLALLWHGAEKDARGYCGRNALDLAMREGHAGVIDVLLPVDTSPGWIYAHMKQAAREGHVDVLKLFIGRGVDVRAHSVGYGTSALHSAAASNQKGAIDALVEAGAALDALDSKGRTAVHHAAEERSCEAVVALLRHGSTIDKADREGETPLHVAVRK